MSQLDLGTLIAKITVDDKGFTAGMDAATRRTQRFTADVQAQGGVVDRVFHSLGRSAKASLQVAATAAAATTVGVAALGKNTLSTGLAYNAMQQNANAALKTMLGSQKAVNEQMEKLGKLAQNSPFSKATFISAQQQLIAFGVEVEKVIPLLDAMQNAVAASGGGSQQLADLAFVVAQIKAAGKITGQDLIQLGQRGINAAEIIGKAFGKSSAEVKAMISKNQIDADQAIDALTKGMMEKFGGATDAIKQQWSGAADRIKAANRDIGADIGKMFIDPAGGGRAVEWGNKLADVLRTFQKRLREAQGGIEDFLSPAFKNISKGLDAANNALQKFDAARAGAQLEKLTSYTPLIGGTTAALMTFALQPIPVIGQLASAMGPLTVGVAALIAASPELRKAGSAFGEAFKPGEKILASTAKQLADLAIRLIKDLSPALESGAKGLGTFLTNISPLAPALVSVLSALAPVATAGAELAASFANLPTPILAAITALAALHGPLGPLVSKFTDLGATSGRVIANLVAQVQDMGTVWARAEKSTAGVGAALASNIVPAAKNVSNELKTFGPAAQNAGNALTEVSKASANAGTGVFKLSTLAKNAGSALAGAFGALLSPANLALGAVALLAGAFAAYSQKQAEATQRVEEYKETLDRTTASVTANTRELVRNKAEQDGALAAYVALGGAADDYVRAVAGEGEAMERVNKTLASKREELKQNELAERAGAPGVALYSGATKELKENVSKASESLRDQSEELQRAQDETRKSTSEAERAVEAERQRQQAIDKATDAMRAQNAAQGSLVDAQLRNIDASDRLNKAIEEHGQVMADANGKVDIFNQNNRWFVQGMRDKIQAIQDEARAFEKTGHTQEEAKAKTEEWGKALAEMAEKAGVPKEQINDLIRTLGGIPEVKQMTFTADTEQGKRAIDDFIESTAKKNGILTLDANNDPAVAQLAQTLGLVEVSTGVFAIDANSEPATAKLFAGLAQVNTSTGVMTIDANNSRFQQVLAASKSQGDNTSAAMSIYANDYASARAEQAQRYINSLSSYIDVYYRKHGESAQLLPDTFANGGIRPPVFGFANGTENHLAQIAPAGAMRLWAEPETGGEAYIPLSRMKRRRSERILAEVASRFGGTYLPGRVSQHANGSASEGQAERSATAQTVVNFTQNIQTAFTKPDSEYKSEGAALARLVGSL
nr:MAG TPA: tail tape measure protein [Caudoviricetes sp.]